MRFAWNGWQDGSRRGKEIDARLVLILLAILILYKGWPCVVKRMAARVR